MGRRKVEERFDRPTLDLVAPAVGDGPDLLDPQRGCDVAGDRVRIHEQDALAAVQLERRGEAHGDRRLADPALRVEDGDDRRLVLPVADLDVVRLDDRPGTVIDRDRADAHRLDAPAKRVDGVRPGEELVADRGA
jgi:hypothetical protein